MLRATSEDLANKKLTTSEAERRYAASQIFYYSNGTQDAIASSMFQSFLGKKPSDDELHNAGMIAIGDYLPGIAKGLLFHRHGGTYADLVDIVFTSEVYREAAIAGVFQRYLGRVPTSAERSAFISGLDEDKPDLVPVIRAVVTSNEYFGQ